MSIVLSLPLDLTGVKVANRITGEQHIVTGLEDAIFALDFGPFYTAGLKVYSVTLGRYLVPTTEYIPLHYYEEPSLRSGLEVCCVIYITNPSLFGTLAVEYQAVGGEFVNMISIIEQLIANLAIDNRPVHWADLIGAPDTFPPANHLHDLGDLYGFEYLTDAIDGLRDAILTGDQASHEEIYGYIDQILTAVGQSSDQILAQLNAHESSLNNPHGVTKLQVGLGNVQNYGVSNRVDAEAGVSNAFYMTPQSTAYAIQVQALTPLANHTGRTDNPHSVTKAQVGLSAVQNYAMATLVEARVGTASRYLGADIGFQLITEIVTTASNTLNARINSVESTAAQNLATHTGNTNNPHGTTKTQVGLGSVENYGIASQPQAEAASANDVYMTPLRTGQAITVLAVTPLNNHIGNTNNPHNTTKAQVGLGSVQNYGVASQTDVNNGTPGVYVTADTSRTYLLSITNPITTALNNHIGNTSNPHNTTAAQVGLGNVPNYPKASTGQAQAGLDDASLMTPYLTGLAIAQQSPVLKVQGRTGLVTLQASDRASMGIAETNNVTFAQVTAGSVGSGGYRTTLISAGIDTRLQNYDAGNSRLFYMPYGQNEPGASIGMRLLATEYLNKPYVFANQVNIAAGTTSYSVGIYAVSYLVISANAGTNPLTLSVFGNGGANGNPDSTRDRRGTIYEDGTNQWAYSLTLKINPGNRTVNWGSVSWGSAGAPALVPNTWNYVVITTELVRDPSSGTHFYGAYSGVFVGGGF